jgi:predicted AlkP superfamily phosphohydrolase/phosphomutase
MNDELINTFVYMCELRDNGRNEDMANCLQDISNYFLNAKKKGKQYVQEQWMKIKQNYMCELDSVKAVSILIELTRKNSSAM